MNTQKCPCGTGQTYEACCGRFLTGSTFPTTAEDLMRSRYTAFVRMNKDYLSKTWHPKTRPEAIHLSPEQIWLGLTIESTKDGGPLHDRGIVEFSARSIEGGIEDVMHEASEFIRVDGKWLYVDDTIIG